MQQVCHNSNYNYIIPIMRDFDSLYYLMSGKTKEIIPTLIDKSLNSIVDVFNKYSQYDLSDVSFIDKKYDRLNISSNSTMVVCFSGGKDSYATALHYKKLGYYVVLYHVKGINYAYSDEWIFAQRAAEKLGLPIYFDTVHFYGSHTWVEHPMKNMIIANMALTYAIREHHTTRIAFGNYKTAFLYDNVFEVCAGDCYDMWEVYNAIIKQYIPSFKGVYVYANNLKTTLNAFLKEPEHLPYTLSCITPTRFRSQFRNRTQKNYNINLIDGRCGCCWKCCAEYIWFCDNNKIKFDLNYYMHCLEVLNSTIAKETGYRPITIDETWDSYLFYSIKKSKAYEVIKDATFSSRGKIKDTNEVT